MIHTGDAVDVMAGMDPESVDAIVCDPHRHDWSRDWRCSCGEVASPTQKLERLLDIVLGPHEGPDAW